MDSSNEFALMILQENVLLENKWSFFDQSFNYNSSVWTNMRNREQVPLPGELILGNELNNMVYSINADFVQVSHIHLKISYSTFIEIDQCAQACPNCRYLYFNGPLEFCKYLGYILKGHYLIYTTVSKNFSIPCRILEIQALKVWTR